MKTFKERFQAIKESKQFNVGILFLFSGVIIWNMTQLIENFQDDRFRIASLLSSGQICHVNWNPLENMNFNKLNDLSTETLTKHDSNRINEFNSNYNIEGKIDDFIHQNQLKDRESSRRVIFRDHGSYQRIYEVVTNFTANNEIYERVKEIESSKFQSIIDTKTNYESPLPVGVINHLSIDTFDLEKSISFYTKILGFEILPNRPNFPFGGAWLIKKESPYPHSAYKKWWNIFTSVFYDDNDKHNQNSFVLHISVYDPEFEDYRRIHRNSEERAIDFAHERYMRRGRHIAFTVPSKDAIIEAEMKLQNQGISYTKFIVPNTGNKVIQLFFFDPDFNGIEIGNYL